MLNFQYFNSSSLGPLSLARRFFLRLLSLFKFEVFFQLPLKLCIIIELIFQEAQPEPIKEFVPLRSFDCLAERHDKLVWIFLHVSELVLILQIADLFLYAWLESRDLVALLDARVSDWFAILTFNQLFLLHREVFNVVLLEAVHRFVQVFLLWLHSTLAQLLILGVSDDALYDNSQLLYLSPISSNSFSSFLRLFLRTL